MHGFDAEHPSPLGRTAVLPHDDNDTYPVGLAVCPSYGALLGQVLCHASSLLQPAQGFHITGTFVSQL